MNDINIPKFTIKPLDTVQRIAFENDAAQFTAKSLILPKNWATPFKYMLYTYNPSTESDIILYICDTYDFEGAVDSKDVYITDITLPASATTEGFIYGCDGWVALDMTIINALKFIPVNQTLIGAAGAFELLIQVFGIYENY